ncbi:MAG TPA: hypothetical protein VFS20_05240 [Longimicrobium sp.]|nr:hypothetical protein [Longimicrobium sp.]
MLAVWLEMRRARRACSAVLLGEVRGWVEAMLRKYAPGGYVIAHANGRDGFLQLALTGRKRNWRRVELGVPDCEWSRPNFDVAVLLLSEGASTWMVEENPGNADVPRFLRVILQGRSENVLKRAASLLHRAADVLDFPADQRYRIEMHGDDHPDYTREGADYIDQMRGPRWLLRPIAASLRKDADNAERALRRR